VIGDTLILADFPNPVGWAIDKVAGFVGGAAAQGFEMIIGGLTAWMLDAVVWVVGGVFNFFLDATDPNVQADWFIQGTGPYATTVGIGAVLLVGFVLIGITQGVLAGDVAGMLRRVTFELPMAVVGMVGLVTVTQALVTLTDQLSKGLLDHFGEDVQAFTSAVGSLASLTGGTATAFVVFLLALISVLAGIVLVAEMVVRASLIYIVVALAPLIFAAQLWPALRGAGRKLLELLVALIVSKLVVAVALAIAAAAAVGVGSGGEVTSLPPPEVMAQNPGGSVTQAVGILLTAAAAFGVAAFSPLLVARLLPLTEAAVVASGIRGGPVRAGQQALSARYYTQIGGRSRLTSLAASQPGGGGGGPATAGAGAGGAAAGAGVAAAGAVAGAARTGARATTSTAESASSPAPTAGGSPKPRPSPRPTPRRPTTEPGGDDDSRS
jgi:type IV secretion system protein TrbL